MSSLPEPWLRGAMPGIPAALQPAAHALVMAREDVTAAVDGISADQLWARPGGITPLGFHVAHISGSTDRLLTYARGEALNAAQKEVLGFERALLETRPALEQLLTTWHRTVDAALQQLGSTPEPSLTDARAVGKAQLPSTVLGLLFHAAEHAARHTGQIVTTAKLLRGLGAAVLVLLLAPLLTEDAIAQAPPPPATTATTPEAVRAAVLDQIKVATATKGEEGFQPDADPIGRAILVGILENEGSVHLELTLDPSREYHIFGACDTDCTDLNTRVMTPAFDLLVEDVGPNDVPRLDARPAAAGPHLLAVSMASCKTICYFGVLVLSRPVRR
jgi:uncharacterized damage-inducible protein DinB